MDQRMCHAAQKLRSPLLKAAVAIFALSATAKLLSAWLGQSRMLIQPDSLLGLRMKELLVLVGGLELVLCFYLLWSPNTRRRLIALVFVSANIICYRFAAFIVNPSGPCPCLGTVTEWIPITRGTLNVTL